MVILHANAIAENGSLCERTARIDRNHRDTMLLLAKRANELIDKGTLARSRRSGDSNNPRRGATGKLAKESVVAGCAILDEGDGACERPHVAGTNTIDYRDAVSSSLTLEYRRATYSFSMSINISTMRSPRSVVASFPSM
jgi:hypothetical protein